MSVLRRTVLKSIGVIAMTWGAAGAIGAMLGGAYGPRSVVLIAMVLFILGVIALAASDARDDATRSLEPSADAEKSALERGDDDVSSDVPGSGHWVQFGVTATHSFALAEGNDSGVLFVEFLPAAGRNLPVEFAELTRIDQLRVTATLLESIIGISSRDREAYRAAQLEVVRALSREKQLARTYPK